MVELVNEFDEKFYSRMFEKVSRSLKYDSNFVLVHKHTDTYNDRFTPARAARAG